MPATNRGWLRLTPAGVPHSARDYLKAQPPTCSTPGVSLVVIALFIIVGLGARRLLTRRRSSRASIAAWPLSNYTVENVDTDTVKPGSGPAVEDELRGDGKTGNSSIMGPMMAEQVRGTSTRVNQRTSPLAIDPQWAKSMDESPLGLMSRPPPAPPLTPPELSTSVFTFARGEYGRDSFMDQPNPDYMSSTETPTSQFSPSSLSGARRRSYTRMIEGGPSARQTSSPNGHESGDASFLSTSYPPTTSLLPPAPPGSQEVEGESQQTRQIEVQGEIISVLDDEGAGWTRHTRVYGGGVCLACAASGGSHGGGFYGANVSPEEMH